MLAGLKGKQALRLAVEQVGDHAVVMRKVGVLATLALCTRLAGAKADAQGIQAESGCIEWRLLIAANEALALRCVHRGQ